MFLRNQTSYDVRLTKGHIDEEHAVAAVLVELAWREVDGRLERLEELPERLPTDPPATTPFVMWSGVSVTASGTAYGPPRAPFVRPASIRVGDVVRRIIVFGERRWIPGAHGLAPSQGARFEQVPVTFGRAFGGSFDVPPGVIPKVELPHPGYRTFYPLNPDGMGYFESEEQARGGELPQVERPDQLVHAWTDRPEPAGFAPCRELQTLRMREPLEAFMKKSPNLSDPMDFDVDGMLRLQHHAPPALIFPKVPFDAPIELVGLGARTIRLAVPPCPIKTTLRLRTRSLEIAPELRFLHVDADRGVVRAEYQHPFTYAPARAPLSIRVERAGGSS